MEFFREAPPVAVALVVIGTVLVLGVSTAMQIRLTRRRAAEEQRAREGGLPEFKQPNRDLLLVAIVNYGGYALMAIGFGIWIFSS